MRYPGFTVSFTLAILAICGFEVPFLLTANVHYVLHLNLKSVIISAHRDLLLSVERPNSVLIIVISLVEQLSALELRGSSLPCGSGCLRGSSLRSN